MDGVFRKIDIDQWDEDKLTEEDLYEPYLYLHPKPLPERKNWKGKIED